MLYLGLPSNARNFIGSSEKSPVLDLVIFEKNILWNITTNKVHEFVYHKYIYCSNSATSCSSLDFHVEGVV